MIYINTNKVYSASVKEPYISDKGDFSSSHGWRVVFVLGHTPNGDDISRSYDFDSKKDCIFLIRSLGLIPIFT